MANPQLEFRTGNHDYKSILIVYKGPVSHLTVTDFFFNGVPGNTLRRLKSI